MDERKRIFQKHLEILSLSMYPTLGGFSRRLAEVEEHSIFAGENGKEYNKGGTLLYQSGRKTDERKDSAISFFSSLRFGDRGNALIIAWHCQPYMLDDFPVIKSVLSRYGVIEKDYDWIFNDTRQRDACGLYIAKFWGDVQKRRAA